MWLGVTANPNAEWISRQLTEVIAARLLYRSEARACHERAAYAMYSKYYTERPYEHSSAGNSHPAFPVSWSSRPSLTIERVCPSCSSDARDFLVRRGINFAIPSGYPSADGHMPPLPKKKARGELGAAYRDLVRSLAQAFDEIGPTQSQRDGYIVSLFAVTDFLLANGVDAEHVYKFAELASALSDLDVGTVVPLLQPAFVANRKSAPSYLWRRRAFVALGVKTLTTSGLSRDEAVRRATASVKTIGELSGSTEPRKAVLSWNDEFSKKRIKNFEAARVFGVGCRVIGQALAASAHDPQVLQRASAFWFRLADLATT